MKCFTEPKVELDGLNLEINQPPHKASQVPPKF